VDLQELVSQIDSFLTWSHADKIRFFAWYLHYHRGLDVFAPVDLTKCFRDLHLQAPSSVHPFLASMERRKPKEILKRRGGYCLERSIREGLTQKYGKRAATVAVEKLLTDLPQLIPNLAERAYLDEAIICVRYGAFRAAIVMAWNLAYDHLCEFVLAKHLTAFNTQLPKSFPKADISVISKRDDFSELKESQVLQVCRSANIISGSLHKILKEKLDRRNVAAHPSGVTISQLTAEEYTKDLIDNVVLKLV
jgi:hypothetical protein